jgi:hypothetical protein
MAAEYASLRSAVPPYAVIPRLSSLSGPHSSCRLLCSGECRVAADIQPFLKDRSFDADAARVMGEAYDKARRMLHDTGQPHLVQEIIAKKIIDIATTGVRDPDELARQALLSLGLSSE